MKKMTVAVERDAETLYELLKLKHVAIDGNRK
jgi:hypothetical protein